MMWQTKFLALLCIVFMLLFQGCSHKQSDTQSHTQSEVQVDPLTRLEIFDQLGRPIELTRDTDPSFRVVILEELSRDTSIAPEPHQIILDELNQAREEVKSNKTPKK